MSRLSRATKQMRDRLAQSPPALPVLARVISYHAGGPRFDDPRTRDRDRPTVDVEVLDRDGKAHPDFDHLYELDLPTPFATAAGDVMYGPVGEGTLVRVGFYEGDETRAYVEAVLGGVHPNPDVEFVLRVGAATITVSKDGRLTFESPNVLVENLLTGALREAYNAHTHMTGVGPSSPPLAPLAPEVSG